MFSMLSKEPARTIVPTKSLLIDEQKTLALMHPVLRRHIAPHLREGQIFMWEWQVMP